MAGHSHHGVCRVDLVLVLEDTSRTKLGGLGLDLGLDVDSSMSYRTTVYIILIYTGMGVIWG